MSEKITAQQIQEVSQLNSLDFFARQIVEGFITGLHRSPFHGFSVEFAEHRLYNPGESVRHIDWKLFGRSDKLFVKRFEEETNLRCHILIDNSSSMLFPQKKSVNKLMFSAYSAAALVYLLKKQRDAAGLTFFGNQIDLHQEPKLSNAHIRNLFVELDGLINLKYSSKNKSTSNIADVIHQVAEMARKRSLIVLFSDMFENEHSDEIMNAIEHMRYNKHEVIVFHVHDSLLEEKLLLEDRPHKIIDMESGEELRLKPQEIRKVYQETVSEFFESMKAKCLQYKTDFVPADINEPFDKVLTSFLIKRSRMF